MYVKSREVIERLKNKVDPEVVKIIAEIAEDRSVQKQKMLELAQLVDTQANVLARIMEVMGVFKTNLEAFREGKGAVEKMNHMDGVRFEGEDPGSIIIPE